MLVTVELPAEDLEHFHLNIHVISHIPKWKANPSTGKLRTRPQRLLTFSLLILPPPLILTYFPRMVEDKYIGIALATSGTLAIGSSFIITKKVRCVLRAAAASVCAAQSAQNFGL